MTDFLAIDRWSARRLGWLPRVPPPVKPCAVALVVALLVATRQPAVLAGVYGTLLAVLATSGLPRLPVLGLSLLPVAMSAVFAISRASGGWESALAVVLKGAITSLTMLLLLCSTSHTELLRLARRVEHLAMAFRLEGLLEKVPHYLSGGEKRKVGLAGALVTAPDLVVLDEPFAGLDPRSRAELAAMLREAHARRGMAVVLATHEVEELSDLVDTVYVLSEEGVPLVRDSAASVFQMPDVLERSNVPVPALAQLLAALHKRGVPLEPTSEVNALADAFAARLGTRVEAGQR